VAEKPSDLQFEHAEFAEPAELACAFCKQRIVDSYFDVNGHVSCGRCRERLVAAHGGGLEPQRFVVAALLGLGAAVAGSVIWYGVRAITHLEIGLIAIVVGILVGTAVRRGARGRGGLAYQVLAVALTYLAVASSNLPYVLNGLRQGLARQVVAKMATDPSTPKPALDSPAVTEKVDALIAAAPLASWAPVAWILLESPFLGGVQNAIGWLILFFGLQQAWRLTRATPLRVSGPFDVGARPAF